ncbi:uncharacterized protein cubi_01956 [Cryptosporidium ubiquitum]|uniref:Uncharacterized protein n=1 Tax=Cryptosporidium ubiquitum TaxID=857276 RepID=A0A1J4MPQ9_9CRYT|nr:uncharacterized protein cubi_01956 [Cryptosporidium ubiquitum]OII75435.1 hypothetical protein cubi_01956 [Cryptosporidium ubiquitum]
MSLLGRKGAKFPRYMVVLALILVIQLFQWVACSDISKFKSLPSKDRYELHSSVIKKRISFLELYLIKRVEGVEQTKSEADEENECLIKSRYHRLVDLLTEGMSFDADFEKKIAMKCLKKSLTEAYKFYTKFLDTKIIYKRKCLNRICSKKPEQVLFDKLEDLAFSTYYLLSLNDLIKSKGNFISYLEFSYDLEHKSEVISILDVYVNLNSYEEGLKVCMEYDMLNILIYPRLDKALVLKDYKTFSSIVRILTMNIGSYVDKYKYYRRFSQTCAKKDYEKKISLISKKILSLMKLISYAVLTKFLILADIENMEMYEQSYKSIVDDKQQ